MGRYVVGDTLVYLRDQSYWRITAMDHDSVGRVVYDLTQVGSENTLCMWPELLVNDPTVYAPHSPTLGDKYSHDRVEWELTKLPSDSVPLYGVTPRAYAEGNFSAYWAIDREYTASTIGSDWVLMGRYTHATPSVPTSSSNLSDMPMSEGDAQLLFFAADRGTWGGYDGERLR